MARLPQTSPEEVLALFEDRPDRCEPRHAPEVAELLDCSRNTAREKLEILVDYGELRKKDLGSIVFWRPCYTEDISRSSASTTKLDCLEP